MVCMLYLTYRNRKTALRFPEPDLMPKEQNAESMGLLRPEREWLQERPKSAEHLKVTCYFIFVPTSLQRCLNASNQISDDRARSSMTQSVFFGISE